MFTAFSFLLGRKAALGQKGPSLYCYVPCAGQDGILGEGHSLQRHMPWHRVKVGFWSQTAWAQLCYSKFGVLGK